MRQSQITTPRFLLRSLTADDVTSRYSSWFDEKIASQYITAAKSDHGMDSLRAYIMEREGRDDVFFLGIFTRNGGEHIGNIKYEPVDIAHGYAVMGILIGEPEWRGKRVAEEVILHSSKWLHHMWGITEVLLGVSSNNIQAIRAYEKVGFKQQPTDKILLDPLVAISMILHLDENQC